MQTIVVILQKALPVFMMLALGFLCSRKRFFPAKESAQ